MNYNRGKGEKMSNTELKLLDAAWCHYRSKLLESEANLETYLSKMEAIPDHSSALKEIIFWTNEAAHAKMALEVLRTKMPAAKLTSTPPWRDMDTMVRP
jgi:hypothetical protein